MSVQQRSMKASLAPLAMVFALMAASLGPWPQLFTAGGFGAYGLLWGVVVLSLGLSLLQYVAIPSSLQVPTALLTVPVVIALLHSGIRFPPGYSIPMITTFVAFPIALIAGVSTGYNASPRSLRRIESAMSAMAIILPFGLLAKLAIHGSDGRELSSRPFGQGCALVFLWIVSRTSSPIAALRSPLVMLTMAGMALSLSRTAMLMAIAGFMVLLITSYRNEPMRIVRVIAIATIGAAALFLLISNVDIVRQRFTGVEDGSTITLSSREDVWPGVARAIIRDPLVGHGAGESARFVSIITDGRNENPHNEFLRMGYDVGLIGLGSFLLAMYMLAKRLRQATSKTRLVRAGLATIAAIPALMAFTNGLTYLSVSIPILLIIGLSIGHMISIERKIRAERPLDRAR